MSYSVIIKSKEAQVTSTKDREKEKVVMIVAENKLAITLAKGFSGFKIYTLSGKLLFNGVLNQNGTTVINTSGSALGNQAVVVELIGKEIIHREKLLLRN